jgi:hypothetical protein
LVGLVSWQRINIVRKEVDVDKLMQLLKSRKFWAALVGLVLIIVKAYSPTFPFEESQVTAFVVLLVSYILGTAVEDGLRAAVSKPGVK